MGLILLYVAFRDKMWWSRRDTIYLSIGILGLLCALAIALALIFRRAFCTLPMWVQWITASILSLMLITSLFVFAINVH